jgi:hypothetical protein
MASIGNVADAKSAKSNIEKILMGFNPIQTRRS